MFISGDSHPGNRLRKRILPVDHQNRPAAVQPEIRLQKGKELSSESHLLLVGGQDLDDKVLVLVEHLAVVG